MNEEDGKELKRGDGDGGVRPGSEPASQRVICLHTLRNAPYMLHGYWSANKLSGVQRGIGS